MEAIAAALEESDFQKMDDIRARVDQLVEDPATAAALKPWYKLFCKRPCFHDAYLQSYNRPNVQLVDTDGKGVDRITPNAVVVGDTEYEIDCLIYATGFEVSTAYTQKLGFDPVGRDGVTPVGALGERHAHDARHARPRLPEPVPHRARPGRVHGQLPPPARGVRHADRARAHRGPRPWGRARSR